MKNLFEKSDYNIAYPPLTGTGTIISRKLAGHAKHVMPAGSDENTACHEA